MIGRVRHDAHGSSCPDGSRRARIASTARSTAAFIAGVIRRRRGGWPARSTMIRRGSSSRGWHRLAPWFGPALRRSRCNFLHVPCVSRRRIPNLMHDAGPAGVLTLPAHAATKVSAGGAMRRMKRSLAWLERRNYRPALRERIAQRVSRRRRLGAAPASTAGGRPSASPFQSGPAGWGVVWRDPAALTVWPDADRSRDADDLP